MTELTWMIVAVACATALTLVGAVVLSILDWWE